MKFAPSYQSTLKRFPMLESPAAWLCRNGGDPMRSVNDALTRLEASGRFLPPPSRDKYAAKVILGEFFVKWIEKHQGKHTLKQLKAEQELIRDELEPYLHAIIAAADERAFERVRPRMARSSMLEQAGLTTGTADDFTGFVADRVEMLGEIMLSNFDASKAHRPDQAAVSYLCVTAVSSFLARRTKPIRSDAGDLRAYLDYSRKLSERSKLAFKLAYLPALLTPVEKDILSREYGFEGSFTFLEPIQDIAYLLGYKNPDALSRKLYRIRQWSKSSHYSREGGRHD